MKFSTMLATLNDERIIGEAIASAQAAGCDDVVVVVDDRTTDKTEQVAQASGARVMRRKFDGFATQKNFGIDQTRHDWVLILDTDERLTPELQRAIRECEPAAGVVAYEFAWRNYVGKKWLAHGGLYPDRHTRLIDRRQARYGAREIHEELEIDGRVERLEGDVVHLTYAGWRAYYAKVAKYARLEAAWTKERPTVRSAVKEFLVRYVKLEGWRDGWAGLLSAALMAYYRLVVRWNWREHGQEEERAS